MASVAQESSAPGPDDPETVAYVEAVSHEHRLAFIATALMGCDTAAHGVDAELTRRVGIAIGRAMDLLGEARRRVEKTRRAG